MPPCDVALVFALDLEAGGYVDLLQKMVSVRCANYFEHAGDLNGRRIVVAESGVGRPAAAQAADDVLTIHKPAWLISAGFAGSLVDEVRRGHFVLADTLVDESGRELDTGLKLAAGNQPGIHSGRLLTVDRVLRDEAEKRALATKHHAVACDMETMAVAEVSRRHRVRFLSVRIISDAVADRLPPEVEQFTPGRGAFQGQFESRRAGSGHGHVESSPLFTLA